MTSPLLIDPSLSSTSSAVCPRLVALTDGSAVPVHEIQPGDAVALQRFHSRLSAMSVFRRFLHPVPQLDDEGAAYFTQLDGINRHAVVALDPAAPGEIIAVVRYDRD